MKISYIDHSGFLAETETANFLFDWWKGKFPDAIFRRDKKPLYVLVSHSHEDHFDPKIFDLKADAYIFSAESRSSVSPKAMEHRRIFFLRPHQGLELRQGISGPASIQVFSGQSFRNFGELQRSALQRDSELDLPEPCDGSERDFGMPGTGFTGVYTLASNDLGVAYAVTTPEGNIYHAGDLNNWWWDGDASDRNLERIYHRELERIKGVHFKAAMIPYDLRLKEPGYGIRDFLRYCTADAVYPMHVNSSRAEAKKAFEADPVMKILCGAAGSMFRWPDNP